jgi:hypothetical protein
MWRSYGMGEIYAYLPPENFDSLCVKSKTICSSAEYGISIGRGQFSFSPGTWTNIGTVSFKNSSESIRGFCK